MVTSGLSYAAWLCRFKFNAKQLDEPKRQFARSMASSSARLSERAHYLSFSILPNTSNKLPYQVVAALQSSRRRRRRRLIERSL